MDSMLLGKLRVGVVELLGTQSDWLSFEIWRQFVLKWIPLILNLYRILDSDSPTGQNNTLHIPSYNRHRSQEC